MDQFEMLRTTLNGLTTMPTFEWGYLASILRPLRIEKNGYLLRQGEFPSTLGYIEHGLFRVFFITESGDEKTHTFREEGRFLSGLSPFLERRRSPYFIQAIEDSELACIDLGSIDELRGRHPCWEAAYARYAEKLFLEKERREREFLSESATTRYRTFVSDNPMFEARIPQYLIASYLGITPVALSRIRAHRN